MINISTNEFQVENWAELHQFLFAEYEIGIDRFRSQYAYRGVSSKNYGLETSIQRIGRKPSDVENHLVRNFQKYSPINTLVDTYNNLWNWISLAQHHGLPTRLLDWSFSPNVALHFATDDLSKFHLDGAIWMVDFVACRNLLPSVLKPDIYLKRYLTFTTQELSEQLGHSLQKTYEFFNQYGNYIIFFEPPSIDNRIVNQFALFSFMVDPDSDKLVWLNQHPNVFKKLIIPAALKWEIRDKLDQANITERIIYPGLDGISNWLKRWYSEKNDLKKWTLS
jgi:hypothetical protein